MTKILRYVLVSALGLFNTVAYSDNVPTAQNPFGIEFSIGSIGDNIDSKAFDTLLSHIGNNIRAKVIDKMLIYGYGTQAGFSGCIEASPGLVPSVPFNALLNNLSRIQPKEGTLYSIKRILKCPKTLPDTSPNVLTTLVAQSDGSITCKLGSGVSLETMRQRLTRITVYAYHKLFDGVKNPTECGQPAGVYNVYVIPEASLKDALALGFLDWNKVTPFPLTNTVTTYASTTVTFRCFTLNLDGTNYCYKYKMLSPTSRQYITRYLGSCPNNPPSNCPRI